MASKLTAEDVDAFMRQFRLLIAGIVVVIMLPLIIYAFYLDRRMSAFEDSLRYRPPQQNEGEDIVPQNDTFHLAANPVAGQIVYVPAYSHIYHGDGDPYLLTITLSVRNTSMEHGIVVRSIRYFDTRGTEIKSYLTKPIRLPPLAATEVLIERNDASGGSGANFLVEWFSDHRVTEPIIEAVMIDTNSQQGISFARRGSVISEAVPADSKTESVGPESAAAAPSESP